MKPVRLQTLVGTLDRVLEDAAQGRLRTVSAASGPEG